MTLSASIKEWVGLLASRYPDRPVPTEEFQLVLGFINSDLSYNKTMKGKTLSKHISSCRNKPVLNYKELGLERDFSFSKKSLKNYNDISNANRKSNGKAKISNDYHHAKSKANGKAKISYDKRNAKRKSERQDVARIWKKKQKHGKIWSDGRKEALVNTLYYETKYPKLDGLTLDQAFKSKKYMIYFGMTMQSLKKETFGFLSTRGSTKKGSTNRRILTHKLAPVGRKTTTITRGHAMNILNGFEFELHTFNLMVDAGDVEGRLQTKAQDEHQIKNPHRLWRQVAKGMQNDGVDYSKEINKVFVSGFKIDEMSSEKDQKGRSRYVKVNGVDLEIHY